MLRLKARISGRGSAELYFHESKDYFRCVENLPDTIVADLVILGVCFSDRIFEQWKPKIIAATPGFSPMALTVKPGYSNDEMVKGYVWPADVVSALNQVFYNNAYSRMTVKNIVDQFRVEYQNRIRQWGGSPFVVAEVKK